MTRIGLETDMECISKLNESQKMAFMQAFAHLAHVDGVFDDSEKRFIKEMAMTFGLKEHHKGEILRDHTDEEILNAVKSITDRRAALELVKEMCILAHADSELTEKETLLIGKVGTAMGIELEKIQQISNWIIDRIIWLEEAKLIFEDAR